MGQEERIVAARLVAVATIGIVTVSRELAARAVEEGCDPDEAAEESLCLAAAATIAAASAGLETRPGLRRLALGVLRDVPQTYADYFAGVALVMRRDAALLEAAEAVGLRLVERRRFWAEAWPERAPAGEEELRSLLQRWTARIGLETSFAPGPDLEGVLAAHLRLIETFARSVAETTAP